MFCKLIQIRCLLHLEKKNCWYTTFCFESSHVTFHSRGHHGCDRMVVGLQLPMQSVPITTDVVSSKLKTFDFFPLKYYQFINLKFKISFRLLIYIFSYLIGGRCGRDRMIYNYLCNQSISPLTLWVWIPFRWGVLDTTLCDKVLSVSCDRSVVFSGYSGFLHQ